MTKSEQVKALLEEAATKLDQAKTLINEDIAKQFESDPTAEVQLGA